MARAEKVLVQCPHCGAPAHLPNAWRRDANLTMTCASCSHVHLALNAVRLATFKEMTARGLIPKIPKLKPLPIAPIQVFPQPDGKTELVFRRSKRGGERAYTRKVKAKPRRLP